MASRREQKEQLKAERLERERQAQSAERRKKLVGYGAGGVLVAGILVALLVVILAGGDGESGGDTELANTGDFPAGSVPPPPEPGEGLTVEEAAEEAGCEFEQFESEGREHVEAPDEIEYKANPPTSGTHSPIPAEDGAYTETPAPGELVHTLEHGRVFIQFDPAAPDSVRGDLAALYDEDPYHMVIAPNNTDMPFEVAATAWTRSLGCPEMNEQVFDAIRAFRDEYRDEGPETVP